MAKFVGLLLCLAVLVHTGFSLKCYNCHSEKVDGCLKSTSPKDVTCGGAAGGAKSVCYYRHSYDSVKKMDMVNATCAQLPPNTPNDQLGECKEFGNIKNKECRVCDTDLCNSAPVFSNSLLALLCLPVMYFVTKFLL